MLVPWQQLAFLAIIGAFGTYSYFTTGSVVGTGYNPHARRLNEMVPLNASIVTNGTAVSKNVEHDGCLPVGVTNVKWAACTRGPSMIFYIIGVLYMFAALAIVCDEYFVPALEEITEAAGVSDDVAGATFMAAGGSAPELFTSAIGTFSSPPSAVGFGTIVGSAVFNVLFVIGMCAVYSKEVLTLTWWPLARDSTYYAFSLLVLAMLFKSGPNQIEWWEALILLCMYGGYVFLMSRNQKLHTMCNEYLQKAKKVQPANALGRKTSMDEKRRQSAFSPDIEMLKVDKTISPFLSPTTFRAGVLQLLITGTSMMDRMSRLVVSAIEGDVDKTFDKIDTNGNGSIDKSELGMLFEALGLTPSKSELDAALDSIDTSHDAQITKDEFVAWYSKSEMKIKKEMRKIFDEIDEEKTNCIEKHNMKSLMAKFNNTIDEEQVDKMFGEAMGYETSGSKDKLSFEAFSQWYQQSLFWNNTKENLLAQANEAEDDEDEGVPMAWPDNPTQQVIFVLLFPLTGSLYATVPDCRIAAKKKYFPLSFFLSIMWIGVYSFCMVEWATLICFEIGMPVEVMGLTVLAAGTSIPDLITSVIVARQGLGDMAVSSSIGSNIFDVLIGLPLPWFFFTLVKGKAVSVECETLFFSILVLLLMLVAVISTIAMSGWKMTKTLGYTMFCFYLLFVAQDLMRQYGVFTVNF